MSQGGIHRELRKSSGRIRIERAGGNRPIRVAPTVADLAGSFIGGSAQLAGVLQHVVYRLGDASQAFAWRVRGSARVSSRFAQVSDELAHVGESFARTGEEFAHLGELFAHAGESFAHAGERPVSLGESI